MEIGKFVDRRLHGVRLAVNLLSHEMDRNPGQATVALDRNLLSSVVETLSMFVEDFEASHRVLKDQAQKKFVQSAGVKAS